MAARIQADRLVIEKNNLHYIPCQIAHNGPAKITAYFDDKTGFNGAKTASFRGRPLIGVEVEIPENFRGYVLRKSKASLASVPEVYQIQQSFRKLNYWNLDKLPSQNDTFLSAFDWFHLSEALHSRSA